MARPARADNLRTVVCHLRPSPVSRLDVATPGTGGRAAAFFDVPLQVNLKR